MEINGLDIISLVSVIFLFIIFVIIAYITYKSPCYLSLIRPSWLPSKEVLMFVLVIVYILSLIGYYIVYNKSSDRERATIVVLFIVGYGMFTIWFYITYNACYLNLGLFFITLTILIYMIMMVYMIRIDNIGGLLQLPYVLWVLLFYAININYTLANNVNITDLQIV